MTYTPAQLEEMLRNHALWVAGESGGRPVDFSGADLRNANLRATNLHWAPLIDADLRGADLTQARLIGADLTNADLRGADLSLASLEEADVRQAQFSHANLHGTVFCCTLTRGATFGSAGVVQLGPLGSRQDYLVLKRFDDGTTEAMTGCFKGTLEGLAATVERTHADHPLFLQQYRTAIAYARALWALAEPKEEP